MSSDDAVRAADRNVYQAFSARFPADRRRRFLESFDGRLTSYGDVEAGTARVARLLERAGVRKGDRVAGLVDKSAEAILLSLASSRLAALYMPPNTAYRPAELDYIFSDSTPSAIVCAPELE